MRSRGHAFGLKKVKSALCDTTYALCSCSSFSPFLLFPLCLTSVLLRSFAHIFLFIRHTHMRSRGHEFGLKKVKSALCDTTYALCSCYSFPSFFLFPLCLTSVLLRSFAHIFLFIRPTI